MQNAFKHIGLSYLLLIVLVKVIAVPVIALHYLVNKDYIAANLCENRSRPIMRCYGKCHLRKQLAKTTESSSDAGQKVNTSTYFVDYCEPLQAVDINNVLPSVRTFHIIQSSPANAGFPGNIFHPPIA